MFGHYKEPLLRKEAFRCRLFKHFCLALSLVAISLGVGILGYHRCEGLG